MLLDMGEQPLAERMSEGKAYPLALLRCGDCSLVQLSHIVDQREMFPPEHPYASGNTAAIVAHCRELAASLTESLSLGQGDLVVDIGANDGTLLRQVGDRNHLTSDTYAAARGRTTQDAEEGPRTLT